MHEQHQFRRELDAAAGREPAPAPMPATTSRIDGAILSRRASDRDHDQHRQQKQQDLDGRWS